jgi:hypothetical protein
MWLQVQKLLHIINDYHQSGKYEQHGITGGRKQQASMIPSKSSHQTSIICIISPIPRYFCDVSMRRCHNYFIIIAACERRHRARGDLSDEFVHPAWNICPVMNKRYISHHALFASLRHRYFQVCNRSCPLGILSHEEAIFTFWGEKI